MGLDVRSSTFAITPAVADGVDVCEVRTTALMMLCMRGQRRALDVEMMACALG